MTEKRLARVESVDLEFEDHGTFTLNARFDYGDGCQGLGHNVDEEYIRRFMWACGKRSLKACVGTIVQVTIDDGLIRAIEPPGPFQPGHYFAINLWGKDADARYDLLKEHDLLGKPHPDMGGW